MTSQLSLYNMNILPSVSFFIAFFRQVLVEERTLTLTIQGDIGFGVVRNCVFQKYCGVELELKVEVTFSSHSNLFQIVPSRREKDASAEAFSFYFRGCRIVTNSSLEMFL